jgi:transcriptional regulator with XRE-family HTH domain
MATGPQLRVARVARGLTLVETARRVGVGMSTLSRLENGIAPLRPDLEARIKAVVQWNQAFDELFVSLAAEDGVLARASAPDKPRKRQARASAPQEQRQPIVRSRTIANNQPRLS